MPFFDQLSPAGQLLVFAGLFAFTIIAIAFAEYNRRNAPKPTPGTIKLPEFVCLQCHHKGQAKLYTQGSDVIEIILWLVACVPGLIYSVWRRSGPRRKCSVCGSPQLIPAESPRAKALLGEAADV